MKAEATAGAASASSSRFDRDRQTILTVRAKRERGQPITTPRDTLRVPGSPRRSSSTARRRLPARKRRSHVLEPIASTLEMPELRARQPNGSLRGRNRALRPLLGFDADPAERIPRRRDRGPALPGHGLDALERPLRADRRIAGRSRQKPEAGTRTARTPSGARSGFELRARSRPPSREDAPLPGPRTLSRPLRAPAAASRPARPDRPSAGPPIRSGRHRPRRGARGSVPRP